MANFTAFIHSLSPLTHITGINFCQGGMLHSNASGPSFKKTPDPEKAKVLSTSLLSQTFYACLRFVAVRALDPRVSLLAQQDGINQVQRGMFNAINHLSVIRMAPY